MPPPAEWWLAILPIAAAAFVLRVGVHVGRTPGGVDTWYYLAYADAFRRRPSLDVRLPQYLLQDERQAYPPVFPSLLGLLPRRFLLRCYWAISPAVDCVHLMLLAYVAHRLTASLTVAALAAGAYAVTPQLVSEVRSLTPRPFGALLASVALLALLKAVALPSAGAGWQLAAALCGTLLLLASAAMSAAWLVTCAAFALVFRDWRPAAVAASAFALALVVSGGHFARVLANYAQAVRFWARNRRSLGMHSLLDSPIYGDPLRRQGPPPARPGFLGRTRFTDLLRLAGENPFLVALPLAPYGLFPYGPWLYTWAISLVALSLVATLVPPLSTFGPGRSYMRAAVFPTAYTLAFAIGSPPGLLRPVGVATLMALAASLGGIFFFYAYVRGRDTEQTTSTPEALRAATQALAARPAGAVLVLPYMYADYVLYHSGKPVLWGGHSGNHDRLEALFPVIREDLRETFERHGVRYALLDRAYVGDWRPPVAGLRETASFGPLVLLELA
ncbi:MAG: hypothetical protein AB7O37_09665 [Vicinamibacteria bacterium]